MKELEAGDYVTSSVRLLEPLAEGGMGTVWIAEHLVLETHVVVKVMTKRVARHAEAAARFAREAAIAAAVKSPNVVQVFDSGVTKDGVAFIVMELLEGHDLAADLAAYGRIAADEVAVIITQLVKALATAHRVGVVHRDVKPENVFLCDTEPGEFFVKLLDFGTAKDETRASVATMSGQLLGTPYYMSPEQLMGEHVDARTDVWSLGVLAFEALTGTRPFEGETLGAITLAIHTTSPRLTDRAPDLPPALDAWFARACARERADRFQTARAAGEAFAHAMKDYATRAVPLTPRVSHAGRPPARAERLSTSLSSTLAPPRREHRMTTLAVAAVFAASVVGMFAAFTYDRPHDVPRPSASSPAPPSSTEVVPVTLPAPPTPLPEPAASVAATANVAAASASTSAPRPSRQPVPPVVPPLAAPVTSTAPASTSEAPAAPPPNPEPTPPEPELDPPAELFRSPD